MRAQIAFDGEMAGRRIPESSNCCGAAPRIVEVASHPLTHSLGFRRTSWAQEDALIRGLLDARGVTLEVVKLQRQTGHECL